MATQNIGVNLKIFPAWEKFRKDNKDDKGGLPSHTEAMKIAMTKLGYYKE